MSEANQTMLDGFDGANPLGFLATMGLLRLISRDHPFARLGFVDDGSFRPFVRGVGTDLVDLVEADVRRAAVDRSFWLEYAKQEKKGIKQVADLKAPPEVFRLFLASSLERWSQRDDEAAAFAAAYGTSVAVDGKGNTKPTAFHFTAANQTFLGAVETTRTSITRDWIQTSLFEGHAAREGPNLRWDPSAERNWALMANNPVDEGTRVDAPLEWLAFRGLPLFPSFPIGSRIMTTAVRGRGDAMSMTWPLWSLASSLSTVRSVLQMAWTGSPQERQRRGVFALCSSTIRRTSQGFGNFSPSVVVS